MGISVVDSLITENAVTFTLTSANAESVAWLVLESGEEIPTAETILTDGTSAATGTATCTVDGLQPATAYVIVAAASNADTYSSVAGAEVTTLESENPDDPDNPDNPDDPDDPGDVTYPTIEFKTLRATRTSVVFSCSYSDAEEMAYMLTEYGAGVPKAEQVFEQGTVIPVSDAEITIENCQSNHTYVLIAAARKSDTYSEVINIGVNTLNTNRIDYDINTTFTSVEVEAGANNKLTAAFEDDNGNTLHLSFYATVNSDGTVAAGTYVVADATSTGTIEPGDIDPGNYYRGSYIDHYDADWMEHTYGSVESGTVVVNAGSTTVNLKFNTYFTINGAYSGELVASQVSQIGSTLTQDYTDLTFDSSNMDYSWTGFFRYSSQQYSRIVLDQLGGNQLCIYLNQCYDEIPTGTFSEGTSGATFRPGTASSRWMNGEEGTGMEIRPNGFSSSGKGYILAPADHGTITITDNEDGTFTLTFELYDDLNYKFSGTFTGSRSDIPVYNR